MVENKTFILACGTIALTFAAVLTGHATYDQFWQVIVVVVPAYAAKSVGKAIANRKNGGTT